MAPSNVVIKLNKNVGRSPREFGCFKQYNIETFQGENGRGTTACRSTSKGENLCFLWCFRRASLAHISPNYLEEIALAITLDISNNGPFAFSGVEMKFMQGEREPRYGYLYLTGRQFLIVNTI